LISRFRADLGLVSVTFFWSTTFVLSKLALDEFSLSVFLFLRLTLAALALNLYSLRFIKGLNRKTLLHGAILGIFLYLSYLFQMWGIQYTTASNTAFIMGLFVVWVPLLGYVLFRFKPARNVLLGIVLAIFGMVLLTGGNPAHWNKGDVLVSVCTVTVAFHIIFTKRFAPQNNVYLLTAMQLATVSLLTIIALPFSEFSWPEITAKNALVLIYLALFGTVYTFLMQASMQRFTTAARTALIFSLEPVLAAMFAYLIAGETLSLKRWTGGLLIVMGMIFAEVPWNAVSARLRYSKAGSST
jgi:drug/metabolite transporter (DMT)-like permease